MANEKDSTAKELERLEKERRRTEAEIARLRSYLETEMERAPGEDEDAPDAAADIYEREKTLSLIRALEDKLASIEHALRSTAIGKYGICERCGERIDPARAGERVAAEGATVIARLHRFGYLRFRQADPDRQTA
ncbi:MAG: hypothetical protein K6V36_13710, partial [Anaerolineae bacterium]|nr:hypothetical protein [Anaerolineae bacterium]